jgi:cation-transporting ATPase F
MESLIGKHWHHIDKEEVLILVGSHGERGLEPSEVRKRQQHFGPNVLSQKKGKGPLWRFFIQFHQPLVYILLVAMAVVMALQEWVDAGVIAAVVVLNAVIGFIQEAKALKAIDALSRSMVSENTVIRGGERLRVASQTLVPGDLIVLASGDKVPADLRLLQSRSLQVDESALTGESVPTEKVFSALVQDAVLADRRNMAYSSSLVTYGIGVGVVIATGDKTEIGRISEMIANTETLDTPLTQRIKQFSHVLLYAILVMAAATLVIGILRGQPMVDSFMAAVALAVGAIPEGLPAAVTIMLAIGVARMAKRRAIIRHLPAVETLGSTTIVCSDKTGTLTQNQMTVQEIHAGNSQYAVSGVGYAPEGSIDVVGVAPHSDQAMHWTVRAGVLCNDSTVRHIEDLWRVEGDPTEGALIVSAGKAECDRTSLDVEFPRIDTLPFESAHQYMATLHETPMDDRLIVIKGSLEAIASRCQHSLNDQGENVPLELATVERTANAMAAKGLRILAFAQKNVHKDFNGLSHENAADGFTLLGLQAMIDPPREEAAHAIAACHRAGIRVMMITGDHALTACAIARKLGMIEPTAADADISVTGKALDSMSDEALKEATERVVVFARVSPDNKFRLVEALQSNGHVVAMTGDGVNDAPALRRADIGVAMALGGTEVAREAADMMLTDDNFASIESAIEEGRGVFDNLKKFIVWTLPTNGGEGLVIFLAVLFGVALPILPVQILWINMTTALLLGLMLAFEPKETDIMQRAPHKPGSPILDRAMVERILLVSVLLCAGAFGLFEWELMLGATEAQARTTAVAVFVLGEAFYLLNCRSLSRSVFAVGLFSNPWIWLGIVLMLGLQIAFTHLPVMNTLFHTEPISLGAWLRATACGALIFVVVGLEKAWRHHRRQAPTRMSVAV